MAQNMTIKDDFIHAFSSNANEPDWFLDIRRNAFKAYGELDLPFVDKTKLLAGISRSLRHLYLLKKA